MLDVVESRAELLQSRLQVVDLVSERTGALPLRASKERGKTDGGLPGGFLPAPEPLFDALEARESVLYQPLPLNTIPTG